jgi:hypothetical protein
VGAVTAAAAVIAVVVVALPSRSDGAVVRAASAATLRSQSPRVVTLLRTRREIDCCFAQDGGRLAWLERKADSDPVQRELFVRRLGASRSTRIAFDDESLFPQCCLRRVGTTLVWQWDWERTEDGVFRQGIGAYDLARPGVGIRNLSPIYDAQDATRKGTAWAPYGDVVADFAAGAGVVAWTVLRYAKGYPQPCQGCYDPGVTGGEVVAATTNSSGRWVRRRVPGFAPANLVAVAGSNVVAVSVRKIEIRAISGRLINWIDPGAPVAAVAASPRFVAVSTAPTGTQHGPRPVNVYEVNSGRLRATVPDARGCDLVGFSMETGRAGSVVLHCKPWAIRVLDIARGQVRTLSIPVARWSTRIPEFSIDGRRIAWVEGSALERRDYRIRAITLPGR